MRNQWDRVGVRRVEVLLVLDSALVERRDGVRSGMLLGQVGSSMSLNTTLTQMWTPALPNPIPAVEAASLPRLSLVSTCQIETKTYSICPRASASPKGSRAIRGRYLIVVSSAHREKMSEIGFDPWYAAACESETAFHHNRIKLTSIDGVLGSGRSLIVWHSCPTYGSSVLGFHTQRRRHTL